MIGDEGAGTAVIPGGTRVPGLDRKHSRILSFPGLLSAGLLCGQCIGSDVC